MKAIFLKCMFYHLLPITLRRKAVKDYNFEDYEMFFIVSILIQSILPIKPLL